MAVLALGTPPPAEARGLFGLFFGEAQPQAVAQPIVPEPQVLTVHDPSQAVAIVTYIDNVGEDAESPPVNRYNYLYAGDTIELGREGVVTLAYFNPCREEDIRAGSLTADLSESDLHGDATRLGRVLSCRYNEAVRPGDDHWTLGPGRAGPYSASDWFEITIKSADPVFAWQAPIDADARFDLALLEEESPQPIWSIDTARPNLGYPLDAPRLEPGLPYQATVSYAGGETLTAVFSIDPDLGVSSHTVNNIVLLSPQDPEGAAQP